MSRKAPARAANLLIQYPAEKGNSSGSPHVQPPYSPPQTFPLSVSPMTPYSLRNHPESVLGDRKKCVSKDFDFGQSEALQGRPGPEWSVLPLFFHSFYRQLL